MIKRIIASCLLLVSLSGCDAIADVWAWLKSLLDAFWDDIICYIFGICMDVWNAIVGFFCDLVMPLISVLPEYAPPSLDLSGIPFLQYAAYFLPISESAAIMKYLIGFYMSFLVGRTVLKWLKVLR